MVVDIANRGTGLPLSIAINEGSIIIVDRSVPNRQWRRLEWGIRIAIHGSVFRLRNLVRGYYSVEESVRARLNTAHAERSELGEVNRQQLEGAKTWPVIDNLQWPLVRASGISSSEDIVGALIDG